MNMPSRWPGRGLTIAAGISLLALVGRPAVAQCGNYWLPGEGCIGTSGVVSELLVWDPDGPGPLLERVVVAGDFRLAGSTTCSGIALLDPATEAWTSLPPLFRSVGALAELPGGELLVAGELPFANAHAVASWDGNAWSTLGQFDGRVDALLTMSSGVVVAGGSFTLADGSVCNGVARFDGASWSPLGAGVGATTAVERRVLALAELPGGDLVVGGSFGIAGGVLTQNIARWDGVAWNALASGSARRVDALAVSTSGILFAGGPAFGSSPFSGVLAWDGVSWSPSYTAPGRTVGALAFAANGDLLVGGRSASRGTAAGGFVARVAPGSTATTLGAGFPGPYHSEPKAVIELSNGDVLVGGLIGRAGDSDVGGIARFDGVAWRPIGDGLGRELQEVVELPNGDVVVGGFLAGGVARSTATGWQVLGGGVRNVGIPDLAVVSAMVAMPDGDLIVGGQFEEAGGVPVHSIARWDGASWSPLGNGVGTGVVHDMLLLPDGDLIVSGSFSVALGGPGQQVARWDGTAWSPLGAGLMHQPWALALGADGHVYAGGGDELSEWDGISWTSRGAPPSGNFIFSLAANDDGVYVGVDDGSAWLVDAAGWSSLGNPLSGGAVHAIEPLSSAGFDVMLGGAFTSPYGGLARNQGGPVPELGGPSANQPPIVFDIERAANGDLLVVGLFFSAGGAPSAYYARLTTSCAAEVATAGSGCTGSGGMNVLTAASLPWIGETFTAVATGMPSNGLVISVVGLNTTSTPLAAGLPQGQPGCDLLVIPELLDLVVPTAGQVETSLLIPDSYALVGRVLHQQVVPVELDAQSAITAFTASNRLTLTIGAF